MSSAENPQAIYLTKVLRESPNKVIALTVYIPGLPPLSGAVREVQNVPYLFEITAPVMTSPQGVPEPRVFTFTVDNAAIDWLDKAEMLKNEASKIIMQ